MKKNIKFFNKIIVWLLGLGGIFVGNSCVLYGVPSVDYEIKGVVINEENAQPIQNIRVIRSIDSDPKTWDATYTDSNGKYSFKFGFFEFGFYLIFEDIDGEENGGDFETEEMLVVITKADRKKKETQRRNGKYVITQNIKLKKKE